MKNFIVKVADLTVSVEVGKYIGWPNKMFLQTPTPVSALSEEMDITTCYDLWSRNNRSTEEKQ